MPLSSTEKHHAVAVPLGRHLDLGRHVGGDELQRVGEQVLEHLRELARIARSRSAGRPTTTVAPDSAIDDVEVGERRASTSARAVDRAPDDRRAPARE